MSDVSLPEATTPQQWRLIQLRSQRETQGSAHHRANESTPRHNQVLLIQFQADRFQ